MVDPDSAYEILEQKAAQDAEAAKLQAEREAFEREKAQYEKQKAKEEEAAARKKEKAEEAAERKRLRDAERRRNKIETQVISGVGRIIRRGILNTIKKGL